MSWVKEHSQDLGLRFNTTTVGKRYSEDLSEYNKIDEELGETYDKGIGLGIRIRDRDYESH